MGNPAKKGNGIMFKNVMVILLIVCIIPPLSALAADNVWVVTSGNNPYWSTADNWSLGHEPVTGDNVELHSQGANATAIYDTLNNPGLEMVKIDGAGGSTLELQQSSGAFNAGNLYLGSSTDTSGTYNQSGGSNVLFNNLYVSYAAGSSGTYCLSGGSLTSLGGTEYIGYNGTGTFNHTGGSNSAGFGNLRIGSAGGNGTYNLSSGTGASDSVVSVGSEYIGDSGSGTFNQTGGANSVETTLHLGYAAGSHGTYNLSGGTVRGGMSGEIVGVSGSGTFNQTGGSNNSFMELIIGSQAGSNGIYNLNDGILETGSLSSEYIGVSGTGIFNQSGGTHTVSGALIIKQNDTATGVYNLSGGTLTVNGGITVNDLLNYSGGTLNADIINNGTTNLSGIGTRTVNGDLTNNGTVKVTNTTVQYTGTFTNNGAYISDPSVNKFIDLVIGAYGYLQGGSSDQFLLSGSLVNDSTSPLWDTSEALLGFTGTGSHNIDQINDFRWGTLAIYDGGSLYLSGSGDLYVENLLGLTFDGTDTISNIFGNGLNIYYDSIYNPWLEGRTYSLADGGSLLAYNTPDPVPEPATMLLLGAGLIGLAGLRKKRKKQR
ncbi:MAG: PEP-CTERM sorting domain-containing protein [Syntrophaceae bacterium]